MCIIQSVVMIKYVFFSTFYFIKDYIREYTKLEITKYNVINIAIKSIQILLILNTE